jgi:hypothetical protein
MFLDYDWTRILSDLLNVPTRTWWLLVGAVVLTPLLMLGTWWVGKHVEKYYRFWKRILSMDADKSDKLFDRITDRKKVDSK